MARGTKARSTSDAKKTAQKTQKRLQGAGVSKRSAERRAWDQVNEARSKRQAGTAGGRSKVSKRTMRPSGSTSKSKTTGKTRR
jgi:hypothetical protein